MALSFRLWDDPETSEQAEESFAPEFRASGEPASGRQEDAGDPVSPARE